jgi:hypothetical protein
VTTEGEWRYSETNETYAFCLGRIFTATIKRHGGDIIYANHCVATLNTEEVTETPDLEYAQGCVEYAIVCKLTSLAAAYRRPKHRAPTGSDLFPDGAFERWKKLELVKPVRLDFSALKTDPEA